MAGTTRNTRRTAVRGSDTDAAIAEHNRLVDDVDALRRQVAWMMPGALLTAPATKTGTTSNLTWRAEAFSFTFRGKVTAAAAQEKAFTVTTHNVAASKQAWFCLSTQTDGSTFTITKAADQNIGTDVYPTLPDNEVPIAFLLIVTGVTGWASTVDALVADGAKIASLTFTDAPGIGAAAFLAAKVASANGVVIGAGAQ